MKLKNWLMYLGYSLLILLAILLKSYINKKASDVMNLTFHMNYLYVVLSWLLGVFIGITLGLDYFIKEMFKEGSLKINLPKLLFAGIPSLYLSLYYVLGYSRIPFLMHFAAFPWHVIYIYLLNYIQIFELLFGYVIITSFFKRSKVTKPTEINTSNDNFEA